MESWRPAGCDCSPAPRSRGDELGIDDVRHQEGIEEFSVFHVERRVAVSKTYPRGIPDVSNTIFFILNQ